jgi:2-polyprenyl-6-methoxyphenol hydroxylase and related FAD-dependent oxidoreductases
MELKFNIAIVGSGLTGSITSLALAKAGYKVALIDPKSFDEFLENNYDTRTTALSKKSKLFFEHLNLWQAMKPFTCMIKNIMVNDGNPQKNIYFKKPQSKKNIPLGFMIRNKDLFTLLIDEINKNKNINKYDNKVNNF